MKLEVKIPSVGESVQEAVLAQWLKQDGDIVKKDESLFVIETDKVTLDVNAEESGILKILVGEGETVAIGAVVGTIDIQSAQKDIKKDVEEDKDIKEKTKEETEPQTAPVKQDINSDDNTGLSPSVRRLAKQKNVDLSKIIGTGPGDRITKGDILLYLESEAVCDPEPVTPEKDSKPGVKDIIRKPMTPIRKRIAARLLEARQNTAMLTTFNDIDMSRSMDIRSQYKDAFKKKFDVNLGFMSFFIKASVQALKEFPEINAFIEGSDIVYHNYYHVGIAVGSPKGLVVPVIRDADKLGFSEIEQAIVDYVDKIKENRLELSDMEGATFTITNGGVFGSLLSTPILNPPQSGILGMHRIEKKPVVINDEIVIRPMMYVALSYDHRIVDGREAVTFLKRIKEYVENPERMLMEV
ncbi:Dihydrolipoyllysine-residue succinyltransferase component (E2 component of 2-oxoglutarate dehydrogenase complex) [Desulfonema limicola]|uniref:Dihydrolipoyllysine-residue succinyltransferase component of 2-oxoglutarate dehydrogenase complex n=1 Tax=Desulfonema limicola TaxID=45656 RepID=A0A975B4G9_9BACT|nr:2-oxoglutarate dehydrogenase complex dihydrolipoyllysine-residue succinyltransferase [Desulfonema limicola]QTA78594.1 Dihydrolipoyllysine-residue succinyltransferase component (E2 component of 2-oxoglutarate dehydrogenase complex) [Desulfonema limicola]